MPKVSDLLKKQKGDDGTFPYVVKLTIRGVDVKNSNISNIVISESIFDTIPSIQIIFNDYGLFSDMYPIGDGDEIQIQISTDRNKEGIKATFLLSDYYIIPTNSQNLSSYIISVTGFLISKGMFFPSMSVSFSNAKSSDVLTELFNIQGYGVKNPIITNDRMTWLQTNMNSFDMINRVIDYSYKEDGTMVFAFVDKNYEARVTDLITETNKPKVFDAILSHDPTTLYYKQISKYQTGRDDVGGKNNNGRAINILGFDSYRLGFHPGYNNLMGGYGMRGYVYDYDIDPRKYKIKINTDIHPLTDYSMKSKKITKLNSFSQAEHFPMKYTGNNVHKNYQKAYLQNKYLRRTMFSDVLVLNSYFNDEVKLLDKINVDIDALARSGVDTKEINKVYSGEYLVTGIVSQVNNSGAYKSILYLSRGGINQSPHVDKTEMKLNDQ